MGAGRGVCTDEASDHRPSAARAPAHKGVSDTRTPRPSAARSRPDKLPGMPRTPPRLRPVLAWLALAACHAPDDVVPNDTDAPASPADTDVTAVGPQIPGLELGPEQRCADPSLRDSLGPYFTRHLPMDPHTWVGFQGLGVGVGDLDGDGAMEVVLPGSVRSRMVRWAAAGPEDLSDRLAAFDLSEGNGVVPVDLDGDGDLDLFVARHGRPNVVLRNDGTGHFTDDTARSGLAGGATDASMGGTFADIDHDGDLDAFVSNYADLDLSGTDADEWPTPAPNRLYENVGDGVFVDRSDLLPDDARAGLSFTAGFVDLDDDGRWELYVTHDFGNRRVGNTLISVDGFDVAALPDVGLGIRLEAMGLAIGDLNSDGLDEIFVASWGRQALMSKHGGLWFDDTATFGLDTIDEDTSRVGWAPAIADLDNDGKAELFLTYGYIEVRDRWRNDLDQADVLWRRDAAGTWGDQAPAWGLDDRRASRGMAVVDLDGNGVLDVLRPNLDDGDAISLGRCSDGAWLDVSFAAAGANPFGVGARVRVTDGEQTWSATARVGGGPVGSGVPATVHLGLGYTDVVDHMEVRWPDGTVSTYDDVPTRRAVRAVQPGR